MDEKIWEVGGEFHWMAPPEGPMLKWPGPANWYALARDVAPAIWSHDRRIHCASRLFVPDYFCPQVIAAWRARGLVVRPYADDPAWPAPEWTDIDHRPGDAVLAVNYFGVRRAEAWLAWHAENRRVLLIEDHSHDPVSSWSRQSQADYAFASLRKTMPAPDGAILWSPRQRPLPDPPPGRDWNGSKLKLTAMVWKRDYLAGAQEGPRLKAAFRRLQLEGERRLTATHDSAISPWSRQILGDGYPESWRRRRRENVERLLQALDRGRELAPLFRRWPTGHCPLNAILACADRQHRDQTLARLHAARIYATVHWRHPESVPLRTRQRADSLLTVPCDQRYSAEDIDCIAAVLCGSGLRKTA